MKRILVTGAYNIGRAGVATIVYKWGQAFNQDKIVYDYLMQRGLPEEKYQEAIKNKGGKIYTREGGVNNLLAVIKWVKEIMICNGYDTVHINSDTAYLAAAYIYAARKAGISNIYVHSHSTQVDDVNSARRLIKTLLHRACRNYVCKNTKYFLACSKKAGVWMFGERNVESSRYKVIYNGVEIEKYLFNEENRNYYRKLLGIEEKFVLANVGRLSYQKNQEFLINILPSLLMCCPDCVLIFVGEGEMEKALKKRVHELVLEKHVLFLGRRGDVPQMLSAFDVLVMPSRFEGLPVTMVEAQISDLPCVVSTSITREARFTETVEYVALKDNQGWIERIESLRGAKRGINNEQKYQSQFNIKYAVDELSKILLDTYCEGDEDKFI